LKVAFFGDVVGRPGRRAVAKILPSLKEEHGIELAIANIENIAGGIGISEKTVKELDAAGFNLYTSGNHVWDKREAIDLLERRDDILRPANYPGYPPGKGYIVTGINKTRVAVLNLQGRVFMPHIDCPFQAAMRILREVEGKSDVIIVDFHGEATSEKIAMGWFLDGRISLLVGTHTHIPTKDARILPKGTGYVTDVGMTGSYDSVIGMEKQGILERFLTMRPVRFEVAKRDVRSDILIAEIDNVSGKAMTLEHLQIKVEE
jgi:metallophosphoesterase (TIGR00282 family)